MRRALVLTDEPARHPFRASLPAARRLTFCSRRALRMSMADLRDFMMSFCAFFLAALIFIA